MKRSLRNKWVEVIINGGPLICQKCLHVRKGEPFAIIRYSYTNGKPREEILCWRCCCDDESTFLIEQKWPLAFKRLAKLGVYRLYWCEGIKSLIRNSHEAQKTD